MSTKLYMTCNYCDNRWSDIFYSNPVNVTCPVCKDKNITFRKQLDIYGYDDDSPKEDAWIGNDD